MNEREEKKDAEYILAVCILSENLELVRLQFGAVHCRSVVSWTASASLRGASAPTTFGNQLGVCSTIGFNSQRAMSRTHHGPQQPQQPHISQALVSLFS